MPTESITYEHVDVKVIGANTTLIDLRNSDVKLIAKLIHTLAVHWGWYTANFRSFLFQQADHDQKKADWAFEQLKKTLPFEFADLLMKLAKHSSWYAANTRRFLWVDAMHNKEGYKECVSVLKGQLASVLAHTIKDMCKHAAWYTANVRSLMWGDAAKDLRTFKEATAKLVTLLENTKEEQIKSKGEKDQQPPLQRHLSRPERVNQSACLDCLQCGALWRLRRRKNEGQGDPQPPTQGRAMSTTSDEAKLQKLQNIGPEPLERDNNVLNEALNAWKLVNENLTRDGVPAGDFLDAASATIQIVDCMGTLCGQVKSDMEGNVQKIKKNIRLEQPSTLEQMMAVELRKLVRPHETEGSTSCSLLWLARLLRVLAKMAEELSINRTKEVSECAVAAYDCCAAPHYPWMQSKVTKTAIYACPGRAAFVERLGNKSDEVQASFAPFHQAIAPVLQQIQRFMVSKKMETWDADGEPKNTSTSL